MFELETVGSTRVAGRESLLYFGQFLGNLKLFRISRPKFCISDYDQILKLLETIKKNLIHCCNEDNFHKNCCITWQCPTLLSREVSSILHFTSGTDFFLVTVLAESLPSVECQHVMTGPCVPLCPPVYLLKVIILAADSAGDCVLR